MNGKRSFVAASILCLHDTCFLYPACQKCGTRLCFKHGRFQCLKCNCLPIAQNVNYRYRLSVKVAGKCDIFIITVFGSCLEPYFGAAAGFLNRYCEDLKKELQEPEGEKVRDLLVQAVEHCFIGRNFIFGVKASESQTGVLSFSSSLQSTFGKSRYNKHLIACQIAVPNSTIYGCTVINYYKKLLDSTSLKDLSSNSLPFASPFNTNSQSTPKINSLSLLSGNTQPCTEVPAANQLPNPWQHDFELTFTSGECITVEELIVRSSRVGLKRSITSLDHVEGATSGRKYDKRKSSAFATSVSQSSDINGCGTSTIQSLPSSVELYRLPCNECTHQYYDFSLELESSVDIQTFSIQKYGDSLPDRKDNVILPLDKSCSKLDCNDSILWDELPFSESLGEFLAKVEGNLERGDEENTLPTGVNASDGATPSWFSKSLESANHSGVQEQKRKSREQGTNYTTPKLLEFGKTRNKKTSYGSDSNNQNDTVEHLILADSFKNVTEKLVSPPRSLPPWSGYDSCAVHTLSREAVGKICSTFLSPINAVNDSSNPVQTIQLKMHNHQADQMGEHLNFPTCPEDITVNKPRTNESSAPRRDQFQTPLPSAKLLQNMEENFNSVIQDEEQDYDKNDQEAGGRSQLLTMCKNENCLFQNLCTGFEEYDVSGELFSDAGASEEEPQLCPSRNQSISSQRSASKASSKTCKPNEEPCSTSLYCLDPAVNAIANQNNNSSENDLQILPKCDFSGSQDYIPFSQSTPVSRVKCLKIFRLGEKSTFKISPYVRTNPKDAAFKHKQVGFNKNDNLKQQSHQIKKMSQRFQISVSPKSSLLDKSSVNKSYVSDSEEWIPPSTIKTQIISRFSAYVSDVHRSRFKSFKSVSCTGAAATQTDSKTTTKSNKENDSSNQFRGHLCMKRTPVGNYPTQSFQQKVRNSKVFQKRIDKQEPAVPQGFQIRKDLKMNESMPAAFHALFTEREPLSCYSPELFAASTEFSEDEYPSF